MIICDGWTPFTTLDVCAFNAFFLTLPSRTVGTGTHAFYSVDAGRQWGRGEVRCSREHRTPSSVRKMVKPFLPSKIYLFFRITYRDNSIIGKLSDRCHFYARVRRRTSLSQFFFFFILFLPFLFYVRLLAALPIAERVQLCVQF